MSVVKIEIEDGKIVVEAHGKDRDLVGLIPGSKWISRENHWTTRISWAAAKQLRSLFGDRLEIGDELYKWGVRELESRVGPSMALRQSLTVSDTVCDGLYPFQQAGASFLIAAQQAILADPMGSGKTIQAIAAARATNSLPALVICPNSTKLNWQKEAERWWPDVPIYVVAGTKKKRQQKILECLNNPGIVVINWESVRLHSKLTGYGSMRLSDEERRPKELNEIPWRLIIVDEAHRMKDPTSKQTRGVWAVGKDVPLRWALTGTPLTDKPDSIYPILHLLNPDEWPSKVAFISRYCQTVDNYWSGGVDVIGLLDSTKEEFFEIFDPRFRRLPKEVILPELPPVQVSDRYLEMDSKQSTAYRRMAEDMMVRDDNGEFIIAVNPISKLTRLIQYSSAYLEKTEDRARLTDPSNKLDALMNDLPDWLAEGEPVVVFAVHRQLIELAEERLKKKNIPYSVIKGQQSERVRQENIDRYMAGEVDVILVVIAAGGVGINLNRGRIGVFLQLPWSMVEYNQAMGRIHRIGSERFDNVLYVRYLTPGTVEMRQPDVLEGKIQSLEQIVRDQDAISKFLSGEAV